MTIYILDPNLTASVGHHLDWDLMIARVARARGEDVVIFANDSCEITGRDEVEIIPWFAHSCYETRSRRTYTRRFDDFRYFNDTLADELAAIPTSRFHAVDCVLVPTLTEQHLLGYVSWIKTFCAATAPLFVVHLMFPSGLSVSRGAEPEIVDAQQAMFYGLAFERAAEPGPEIHFFGGGRQIAHEFSQLSGISIDPHPIPFRPVKPAVGSAAPWRPKALLYAGDAKADKGFVLVPKMAERLAQDYPEWDFILHANDSTAWDAVRDAFDRLVEIARKHPNIELRVGRLGREDYEKFVASADCMVSTYDPAVYARKSSGVLWESISLGIPVIVPEGTWLAKEAKEWNAACLSYSPYSVDAICQAFAELDANLQAMLQVSRAASLTYRELNGPEAIVNQFGRLWAARLLAARLSRQPKLIQLSLEDQKGAGLSWSESLDGATVRWSGREFDLSFEWKFAVPWELTIRAPRFMGAEQVTNAKATSLDGRALKTSGEIVDGVGAIRVIGATGHDPNELQSVRIALPWTHKPEGETRDLGILLGDVAVGPHYVNPSSQAARDNSVTIDSPVVWRDPGISFELHSVVSGTAAADPRQACRVSMIVRTSAPPTRVRALCLYVNGAEVELRRTAISEGEWLVTTDVPASVVARHGYELIWDLVIHEPGHAPASLGGPIVVEKLAFHQEARRLRALDMDKRPAAEPVAEKSQSVSLDGGSASVRFGLLRLDESVHNANGYRHLDLSIFDAVAHDNNWLHLKFKICHLRQSTYLEFRRAPGWPEVFRVWPSSHEDQYGQILRIPDAESGKLPDFAEERDARVFQLILEHLEDIVRQVLLFSNDSDADKAQWQTDVAEFVSTTRNALNSQAQTAELVYASAEDLVASASIPKHLENSASRTQ